MQPSLLRLRLRLETLQRRPETKLSNRDSVVIQTQARWRWPFAWRCRKVTRLGLDWTADKTAPARGCDSKISQVVGVRRAKLFFI